MTFAESAEGRHFAASGAERRTAPALLDTIAQFAGSTREAERIWRTRRLLGRSLRQGLEDLYVAVTRNYPIGVEELLWDGDADWAVRTRGRLLANTPAARFHPDGRRLVFEDYGIRLFRQAGTLIAEWDSGESAGSHAVWTHLSEEQGALVTVSEATAHKVALETQRYAALSEEERAVVKRVADHIADHFAKDWYYMFLTLVRHPGVWAVAFQPINAAGQETYDFHGFDVDMVTGEIRQTL